jgi:hypothetical protein
MLTPPKADKCESLHYLKMNFSGQLEDRRETGALHHGRAAGLNDGSDTRATRGRRARAVAGTHCVILGRRRTILPAF